jgi:Mg-chelatase subunit ChlI
MKSKPILLILLITFAAILLVSCNGASTAVSASNGLSTATRMAVGTLKLEGTSQAVTTDQASELLTLWEGYQSLSDSDTSSQVELEALVNQIEGAMTSQQLKAIDAMELNNQSESEVLSSMGESSSAAAPASTPSASTLSQASPAGGPGGAPSGGDGMGDILSGASMQGTAETTQAVAKDTNSQQVDQALLRALIQLLVSRSQQTG